MRVKRYVVDSMPDALNRIKKELGKDAIILNTKEIRTGGFLGMFVKKKIEVIAATDTTESTVDKTAQIKKPPAILTNNATMPAQLINQSISQVAVLEDPQILFDTPHNVTEMPQNAVEMQLNVNEKTHNIEVSKSKEDSLLEEIKQMKEIVFRLAATNQEKSEIPAVFRQMKETLLNQEVSMPVIDQIMHELMTFSESQKEPLTEDETYECVKIYLKNLMTVEGSKGIEPQTQIVHFVGPTGVGKTTTIAKLAAEQVLKHNRSVGFITSDTYRIAAVEQLKTYATILNIPLEVVFSPQDLAKAFENLKDRELIFMDTAGRNYRNEMYVSELNSLLQARGSSETYLVLSLTTKYKDMKVITENFSKFKLDKVLFTKMDETDSYGAMINLIHDFSLKLSYVTNGQNVPDDISEVNADRIVNLILGRKSHE